MKIHLHTDQFRLTATIQEFMIFTINSLYMYIPHLKQLKLLPLVTSYQK